MHQDTKTSEVLNQSLAVLRDALKTSAPDVEYQACVKQAATGVYERVREFLRVEGALLHAHKSNGRVLKIGQVGPMRNTQFAYVLWRHAPMDESSGDHDRCELCVIDRFEAMMSD